MSDNLSPDQFGKYSKVPVHKYWADVQPKDTLIGMDRSVVTSVRTHNRYGQDTPKGSYVTVGLNHPKRGDYSTTRYGLGEKVATYPPKPSRKKG